MVCMSIVSVLIPLSWPLLLKKKSNISKKEGQIYDVEVYCIVLPVLVGGVICRFEEE